MTTARTLLATLFAVSLSLTAQASAQGQTQPVIIYDYAVNHPTEDVDLTGVLAIGASVPQTVTIATVEGRPDAYYGYFYYQGRPVIVDLTTRSVIRIGN